MRVKKVSISFAAVIWRSCHARAAQNHLVYHKFSVVFADRARRCPEVQEAHALVGDYDYLLRLWENIRETTLHSIAPGFDAAPRQVFRYTAGSSDAYGGVAGLAYFDRFLELHAAHWAEQGKLGHFGDWPDSEAFNRDLIARMATTGRARFYEIAGDVAPAAALL